MTAGSSIPNCKHHLSTYYPGDQNEDSGDPRDKNDQKYLKKWENSPEEIEHMRLQNQIQQQKRIAAGSMEQSKINQAQNNVDQLEKQDAALNENQEFINEQISKYQSDITDNWENISKIENGKSKMDIDKDLKSMGIKQEYKVAKIPSSIADIDNSVDESTSITIKRQDIGYILSRHQGQLSLSDFNKIPEVISSYDVCVKGNLDEKGDYTFFKTYNDSAGGKYGIEIKVRFWDKSERIVHMMKIGSKRNRAIKKLNEYLKSDRIIDFKK